MGTQLLFKNVKRRILVPELEDHRHFTAGETRAELQEALVQIFHGISDHLP